MTVPSIKTITRYGSRYYIDPRHGSKVVGVTSVLRCLPKPFLQYWAAKVVAEEAVDNLGAVMNLVTSDNRSGAIDLLKRAPGRSSGAAADIGTQVHAVAEVLNRGEDPGLVHPDIEPWVNSYRQFLDDWQPSFSEVESTVWSDAHQYAGTADGFCSIDGDQLVMDLKSGKGVYEETSLQLTAYAFGDYLLSPDGTERPIPPVTAAAVVHVRPEGYELVPVRIGEDIFEVFKSLLTVHQWDSETKRGVLGASLKPDNK